MTSNDKYQDLQIPKEIEHLTRQKVVRQLHDGLTQTVSALAMRINIARRLMATDLDAASAELEKVEDLTRAATKEIRHIIFLLRPEEQEPFDLISALELLAEKMLSLFDLEITMDVSREFEDQLPDDVPRLMYAIIEEGIDSARQRNGTQNLSVILNQPEKQLAQLRIEDRTEDAGKEQAFQGVELENIQYYASLMNGSVMIENDGMLMRILLPLNLSIDTADSHE